MSMSYTERREEFRNLLRTERCVRPASVFDGISIRIAEDLGFQVGMFAGSVASGTTTITYPKTILPTVLPTVLLPTILLTIIRDHPMWRPGA